MLNESLEAIKVLFPVFQVLFLYNDNSQRVELEETEVIDFIRVHSHLRQGGSVFITSKSSQKIRVPKKEAKKHKKEDESVTVYYFDHV